MTSDPGPKAAVGVLSKQAGPFAEWRARLDQRAIARASWTLIDQGVVGVGAFVANVVLARQLSMTDYGSFALLNGGFFTLQLFINALLFHPLQVRVVVARQDDQARLLITSLILLTGMLAALGTVLAVALIALGDAELVLPAVSFFLMTQLQEAARRGLHTTFRHRTSVLGDSINCAGKILIIAVLVLSNALTLASALFGMAAVCGFAALVQAFQLNLRIKGPCKLRETVVDYWSVGGCWSLGSAVLTTLRLQIVPWTLAITAGPAAVASFQAALNVFNLTAPLSAGLGNIIPQTAAQAQEKGNAHAWRATRTYALIIIVPIVLYSAAALIAPKLILQSMYGGASPFVDLSLAVRLLILAGLAGTIGDFVVSFLHGITALPSAVTMNAIGTFTTMALALPLISAFGLSGACLAVVGGSVVRLMAARHVLSRTTAEPPGVDVSSRELAKG
jgi:O-antigen/teichoic acid export membrane protein